jgi:phenylacetate-CoA ligase
MSLTDKAYDRSPAWFQNLGISLYGLKVYMREYGPKLSRMLKELEEREHYSYDELRQYQTEKLRPLIRHCYENVPYYRRVMDQHKLTPADIKNVDDLHKMPVLTAKEVRDHNEELVSRTCNRSKLYHGLTGGTTGTPLHFYYDDAICLWKNAVDWRQKIWGGIRPGDRLGIFWGRVLVDTSSNNPPFWRHNWFLNQVLYSSYHLSPENMPRYIEQIRSYRTVALEGYPSTLSILARYLLSQGKTLPLKSVYASSETLYPHQREVISKAFECNVYDFYGMAERVVFATECSHHKGRHFNMDFGVTEILNDNFEPMGTDNMGRIVATSLHNYSMPMIRYRTSDVSSVRSDVCTCGRAFPLMGDITSRAEDIVTTADGRFISFASLTLPVKMVANIAESQIIQEEVDRLTVKIVRRPEFDDADAAMVVAEFQKRLGERMSIDLEYVESIPRTKSGKFRYVISKVPLKI